MQIINVTLVLDQYSVLIPAAKVSKSDWNWNKIPVHDAALENMTVHRQDNCFKYYVNLLIS